uniref:Protein of unassigned function n=1 Tax=Methylobacterium oryzae CBMB20 TaxID=693986 RepID=A0A088B2I0_9HYPH|nr:protein of unassigned function [Methylobacterium oryzae CBMB20]
MSSMPVIRPDLATMRRIVRGAEWRIGRPRFGREWLVSLV